VFTVVGLGFFLLSKDDDGEVDECNDEEEDEGEESEGGPEYEKQETRYVQRKDRPLRPEFTDEEKQTIVQLYGQGGRSQLSVRWFL
jgi:hypothetical protein